MIRIQSKIPPRSAAPALSPSHSALLSHSGPSHPAPVRSRILTSLIIHFSQLFTLVAVSCLRIGPPAWRIIDTIQPPSSCATDLSFREFGLASEPLQPTSYIHASIQIKPLASFTELSRKQTSQPALPDPVPSSYFPKLSSAPTRRLQQLHRPRASEPSATRAVSAATTTTTSTPTAAASAATASAGTAAALRKIRREPTSTYTTSNTVSESKNLWSTDRQYRRTGACRWIGGHS